MSSKVKVSVLFFGATADAVDEREVKLEFAGNLKAEEVYQEIEKKFPALRKNFDQNLHFSVNQEYARGDEIIKDGDELAVFTAVSGG
ncbi:MAG TPA: MoaD/ThiS family protein [Pyrinomonadaceae bacterium]|nr:MoaD/ThiS family protein [Pyrinomonadaceae bacterium]